MVPDVQPACHPITDTQPERLGHVSKMIEIHDMNKTDILPVSQLKNLLHSCGASRATQWYCPLDVGYLSAVDLLGFASGRRDFPSMSTMLLLDAYSHRSHLGYQSTHGQAENIATYQRWPSAIDEATYFWKSVCLLSLVASSLLTEEPVNH